MDDLTPQTEPTPQMRAKRPANPLAGPYGHPIHPLLVTVPIGAWVASFVFDIIGFVADDPTPYAVASRVLILIGLIGAALAAVFGLIDASRIALGTRARRTVMIHLSVNLAVTALFLVNLLIRWLTEPERISVIGFILTIVGLVALSFSGWLGGKMVYRYGVRVADEATQREGFVPDR
jgi:uncharacterized membrane protein